MSETARKSTAESIRAYFRDGSYVVWLFAGALSCCLLLVGSIMILILTKGFSHFMPKDLYLVETRDLGFASTSLAGEIAGTEKVSRSVLHNSDYTPSVEKDFYTRILLKVGNREFGPDHIWLVQEDLLNIAKEEELMLIERREYGNFYGTPFKLLGEGEEIVYGDERWAKLLRRNLGRALALHDEAVRLRKNDIGKVNYQLNSFRLETRRLELERRATPSALADLAKRKEELARRYAELEEKLAKIDEDLSRDELLMKTAAGQEVSIPLADIIRYYQSNKLGVGGKIRVYIARLWEFISTEPRESNTEGGVLPAIFGTVMMVLLMTIFVLPLGVIAAIYLSLYARQNLLTRTIRIAVNNLAGVPSIVYGMFGLGFFVYTTGGSIDRLFYPEALPSPTFGSGGILWASLTLALLTLPVVIIATEEGLTRIPRNLTDGSMALGATKLETLLKISLPIASPAVMTGMILAIARATGEVAPLMIVGVVKLAPNLPLDTIPPFLHLERKFMHLGFHIYDMGFQSPNVEAVRPLVYATASLLLIIIVLLNATAVYLRNRLREKYRNLS